MTALLTLAGAVVVALITSVTTDRRLSRQIVAERERQERELAAGAAQQAATLAHDRELSDLADLRKLLDEAAIALVEGEVALSDLDVVERPLVDGGGEVARDADGVRLRPEVKQRVLDARLCSAALVSLATRLQIRLNFDEPIVQHIERAARTIQEAWTPFVDEEPRSVQQLDAAFWEGKRSFEHSGGDFRRAAVQRVGTVVAQNRAD
jgi:heme exporter protein D